MSKKAFASLGVVAGIALAVIGSAVPAHAAAVTSFTASPTTLRSGDTLTYTVNGSGGPSISDTFVGCYIYWLGEDQFNNQANGPISLPASGPVANYTGDDLVMRFAGWSGITCPAPNTLPVGDPSFDTGVITITSQVEIEPVTLTAGKAISAPFVPYTTGATGGDDPYDWATGGSWSEAGASGCAIGFATITSSLPAGVTVDETVSPNGVAPVLTLVGTPTTAGTYDVCMRLEGETEGSTTAWLTIVVQEPSLPATGLNASVALAACAGAISLAIAGVALVIVRRRRA